MKLRERLCSNKRFLNRRINRYLLTAAVLLLLFRAAWGIYEDSRTRALLHDLEAGRRENARLIAELTEAQRLNRQMLDARAVSQTETIVAAKRGGLYTAEQERRLAPLWETAEYSRVMANPFGSK